MNRRLIGSLASVHFAATARNRAALVAEGVDDSSISVTGNPVIDALQTILSNARPSASLDSVLRATAGLRRIVLTTHRRESFGEYMAENLQILRRFVDTHSDVGLIFPVHPNPVVVETTKQVLGEHPRIHLLQPLDYDEFVLLLSQAWLIVSDSGGVQEEAPTLGKPLIILRENTERPEAIECGIARLVGSRPARLAPMLDDAYRSGSWVDQAGKLNNPFGDGEAGVRIAHVIGDYLFASTETLTIAH
jgi:UDP-N-acetylglucosamine 2-epimerase (non-hydrolysing)